MVSGDMMADADFGRGIAVSKCSFIYLAGGDGIELFRVDMNQSFGRFGNMGFFFLSFFLKCFDKFFFLNDFNNKKMNKICFHTSKKKRCVCSYLK